jgi:methylsterol monooxygenase
MNLTVAIEIPEHYVPTYLESLWIDTFKESQYPGIKLAVVLFIWHEIVFIGRYLPFLMCDYIPYFRQFKIQEKVNSRDAMWKCVKHVLLAQFFVELPMMMLFHPVAIGLGMKFLSVPFPSM